MRLANQAHNYRALLHGFRSILDLEDASLGGAIQTLALPGLLGQDRGSQSNGVVIVVIPEHCGGRAASAACTGPRGCSLEESGCLDLAESEQQQIHGWMKFKL